MLAALNVFQNGWLLRFGSLHNLLFCVFGGVRLVTHISKISWEEIRIELTVCLPSRSRRFPEGPKGVPAPAIANLGIIIYENKNLESLRKGYIEVCFGAGSSQIQLRQWYVVEQQCQLFLCRNCWSKT